MEFEVTCGCRFSKPGPIMQEFSSETSEYLSIRLRASGLVSLQRPSQLSCSFSAWRPTMARNALRISADHPIRCSTCRTIAITVATARASATTAAAGTSSTIATGIGGHRQLLRLPATTTRGYRHPICWCCGPRCAGSSCPMSPGVAPDTFQALLQGLSVVLVGGSASLLSSMLFLGRSRKDGKESCGA